MLECVFTDTRDRVRNSNACQTNTTVECSSSNLRNGTGDGNIGQIAAMIERATSDTRDRDRLPFIGYLRWNGDITFILTISVGNSASGFRQKFVIQITDFEVIRESRWAWDEQGHQKQCLFEWCVHTNNVFRFIIDFVILRSYKKYIQTMAGKWATVICLKINWMSCRCSHIKIIRQRLL